MGSLNRDGSRIIQVTVTSNNLGKHISVTVGGQQSLKGSDVNPNGTTSNLETSQYASYLISNVIKTTSSVNDATTSLKGVTIGVMSMGIDSVTAGTNLTGGGSSGDITISMSSNISIEDLQALTAFINSLQAVSLQLGTDELSGGIGIFNPFDTASVSLSAEKNVVEEVNESFLNVAAVKSRYNLLSEGIIFPIGSDKHIKVLGGIKTPHLDGLGVEAEPGSLYLQNVGANGVLWFKSTGESFAGWVSLGTVVPTYQADETPEGAIDAPVGSSFQSTNGHGVWYKETGTGNTGWKRVDSPFNIDGYEVSDPEGVVAKPPGSIFSSTTGFGVWYKESGTGNTGWRKLAFE